MPPRPAIVLYNPRTTGDDPPLALLHLLRAADAANWDAHITDARVAPIGSPADLAPDLSIRVFAVTMLTGPGLIDGLRAIALARRRWPDVLIVAGGWHPSLAPDEVLAAGIDVCIRGQGERPLQWLLETIADASAATVDSTLSCIEEGIRRSPVPGVAIRGEPSTVAGVDGFADLPPVDYGRMDLAPYHRASRARRRQQGHHSPRRWVPYLSSIGCPYACSFCSDPTVFQRRYSALPPERIAADVRRLVAEHQINEIQFVDETFLVSKKRALAWAEANLASPSPVAWSATARAEQVVGLTAGEAALLARSGCDKLLVGAESGATSELQRIGKGNDGGDVIEAARRLHAAGIRGEFGFILGLPGQTDDEERQTVRTIAEIAAISPSIRLPVFLFTPFPGTPATAAWQSAGGALPTRLEDWAQWDFAASERWRGAARTAGSRDAERMKRIQFYARFFGHAPRTPRNLLRSAARAFARRRFERDNFAFPWERVVWRALSGALRGGAA